MRYTVLQFGTVKSYEFEIFTVNAANHYSVYLTLIHSKLAIDIIIILSTFFDNKHITMGGGGVVGGQLVCEQKMAE